MKKYFFALLFLALLFSCAGNNPSKIKRPVKTVIIGDSNFSGKTFSGHAEAAEQAELNFRVGGMLQELMVNEGQDVKKGQLIAKLDERDFNLKLKAKEASYEQAAAQLQRYNNLYAKGAIAKQEYEQMQAVYENTKSDYKKAQNDINDTKLLVPFNGNIEKKYVENHQEIIAGQRIVRLINPAKLEFHFVLPEINIQYTVDVVQYSIEMEVNKGVFYRAKLKDIVRSSVSGSGIPIILTVDDPAFSKIKVLPGYACTVKLELIDQAETIISVPLSCIYLDPKTGLRSVWKVNPTDSTVHLVPVTTGNLIKEADIIVVSGIDRGDRIVSAGVTMLSEGEKVKINDGL